MAEDVKPPEPDRNVTAILELLRMTQAGELRWSVSDADVKRATELGTPDGVFRATYGDSLLRIGRIVRVQPSDQLLGFFGTAPKAHSEVYLDLITPSGAALWSFPRVATLSDLYAAVRFSASGAKTLVDELVAKARKAKAS